MKSFDDLIFVSHENVPEAVQARLKLDNGLEFSIVANETEGPLYGNKEENLWEVAVFHEGVLLPISEGDTVLGWQTPAQINAIFCKAQARPNWPVELQREAEEYI